MIAKLLRLSSLALLSGLLVAQSPVSVRHAVSSITPADIIKRIGEPYLSRRRGTDDATSERAGLGLGVFIARTLLERTGAKISFTNRIFPDHGAVVQIAWPRGRFEAAEGTVEGPGETDESPIS